MAKRVQPAWSPPEVSKDPELLLYNSLTRKKETFVPQNGKRVDWYSCGPTVYDASHMGHARNYISIDILRRVMKDYFGYKIFFVMNITDIDDKIIKRARQNYLYQSFVEKQHDLETILLNINSAVEHLSGQMKVTTDPDKRNMQEKMLSKITAAVTKMEEATKTGVGKDEAQVALIEDAKDVLSDWLDRQKGSSVTENSIFASLPRFWEEEFHKDMKVKFIIHTSN